MYLLKQRVRAQRLHAALVRNGGDWAQHPAANMCSAHTSGSVHTLQSVNDALQRNQLHVLAEGLRQTGQAALHLEGTLATYGKRVSVHRAWLQVACERGNVHLMRLLLQMGGRRRIALSDVQGVFSDALHRTTRMESSVALMQWTSGGGDWQDKDVHCMQHHLERLCAAIRILLAERDSCGAPVFAMYRAGGRWKTFVCGQSVIVAQCVPKIAAIRRSGPMAARATRRYMRV
jgi:hypothetical protein